MSENEENEHEESGEEFKELLKYTISGYAIGITIAALFDYLGYQTSAIGQWIVRTLSGEGESIFEGIYAIRSRLAGKVASMSEAYGWGKLFGMMVPWVVDLGSRMAGVDMYGVESFYIPYLYALSDQFGASVSGFFFLKRENESIARTTAAYVRHPVMISSLIVILIVPVGLLAARLSGFQPDTQLLTAFETIAANLCWVPPLVGWLVERKKGE